MLGQDGVDLRTGLAQVRSGGRQGVDVDVGAGGEHLAQRPTG